MRSSAIASASAEPCADDLLLADEVVEPPRPQPRGERRHVVEAPARRIREEVAHGGKYARAMARPRVRDEATELLQELLRARHGQPARERDAGRRAPPRVPRGRGSRVRALRARCRSGRTSSRGFRAAAAPTLAAPLAHGHGARRSRRSGRSTRGRASSATGDDLGPRRARHEEPGRGGAVAIATLAPRGLRAGRRPDLRRPRPTRRSARTSASPGSARNHPDAVRAEYCVNEGGGDRAGHRRPAGLPVRGPPRR